MGYVRVCMYYSVQKTGIERTWDRPCAGFYLGFFFKDTAFSEMAFRSNVVTAITVFGENFETDIPYGRWEAKFMWV